MANIRGVGRILEGKARVRSHAYRVGGVAGSLRMRASFARLRNDRRQHPAWLLTGKYVNYFFQVDVCSTVVYVH